MVIFVSVLYLLYKKETYCQYVSATLGLACSTRRFSVSALGVKEEPKKAFHFHILLWCIPCPVKTCFHMITIPLQKLLKRIHRNGTTPLLIRLGRNYGTKLLSIPDIVYPQFTVARKTCAVLSACRKRHCRGLSSRWN